VIVDFTEALVGESAYVYVDESRYTDHYCVFQLDYYDDREGEIKLRRQLWQLVEDEPLILPSPWRLVDMLHVQGYRKQPESRKCPTCGGEGEYDAPDETGTLETYDCPDCVDGRIPARQIHARRDYSTLLVFEK